MKKRIISILAVLVITASLCANAFANGFTMSVTDAPSYKTDHLSGNALTFTAWSDGVFSISGNALTSFYNDSDIKYYTFSNGIMTVRCDKNSFYTQGVKNADFSITNTSFTATLTDKSGNAVKISETLIENLFTVTGNSFGRYTVPYLNGAYIPVKSTGDGKCVFSTSKLGTFVFKDFAFSDVSDKSKWYYDCVNRAAVLGIVSGVGANTFKPERNMTRAELASLIVKATGNIISYNINTKYSFSDVTKDKWYYDCVMQCMSAGIMNGVSKTSFKPEAYATREQIAAVTARVLDILGTYNGKKAELNTRASEVLKSAYTDYAKIQAWAVPSVELCNRFEIMVGHNGKFRPSDNITRAECAKIFYLVSGS